MAKWRLSLSSLGYQFKFIWFTRDRKPVSNMGGWVICWNNETDLGWDFQGIPEVLNLLRYLWKSQSQLFFYFTKSFAKCKILTPLKSTGILPLTSARPEFKLLSFTESQVLLFSFLFYSNKFSRRGLIVFEMLFPYSLGIFYCIPILLLALWVGEQ